MPTTHTVEQGETMSRIAKKYKFSSWQTIYNHPDNESFRALRDNPNIIAPGDEIIIPDRVPKEAVVASGKRHAFCLKRKKEELKIKLMNRRGKPWKNKRVVLTVGDKVIDTKTTAEGFLETELEDCDIAEGNLDVYLTPEAKAPSHKVKIKIGHLDPVETLKGVQERCNQLGFPCGVADGVMGAKTRAGVEAFQKKHGLEVDGVPGPMTKAKLKTVFGM